MSYCRYTSVSDVYVFGSGTHLECSIAYKVAQSEDFPQYYTVPYDDKGTAQRAMLGHLRYLQHYGLRVPEHAITRLCDEIRELDGDFDT